MNFLRITIVAILIATFLSVPSKADDTEEHQPSVAEVLSRLEKLVDRIEKLDQRILRLERILVKRPVRVDKNGIIRNDDGRPIGVWGIDSAPNSGPTVPKR